MTSNDPSAADAARDQPRKDGAKSRQCLKCKATFQSTWNGERICSRCKTLKAWKSGAPPRSYTIGRSY